MKSKAKAAVVEKVVFPPNCPPIEEGQSNNEMIRRLDILSNGLQKMDNDDEKTYQNLAVFLAQPTYMQHQTKRIRLLTACCLTDIFRIWAPETPFGDPALLKSVLSFIVRSIRGVENDNDPLQRLNYFILQNLAAVKSMNLLLELPEEDSVDVLVVSVKTCFSVLASDTVDHPAVGGLMLDVLLSVLNDVDVMTNKVIDAIVVNLLEPHKTQNRNAYKFARELLQRGQVAIETHIAMYFSHAIATGKPQGEEINNLQIYSVLAELYDVLPDLAVNIIPQLEDKITCEDTRERSVVIRTLLSLFSAKGSTLADQLPQLFNLLLNRFFDCDKDIRTRCVDACKDLLLNHPAHRGQVSQALSRRSQDVDENVRLQFIAVVTAVAKTDLAAVNEQLLQCLKDRANDKKFSIRKAALRSLSVLYRDVALSQSTPPSDRQSLSWIKNVVLHSYRREYLDDVAHCEKLLCNCLVPYKEETSRRMQILLELCVTVDDSAFQALTHLMKEQTNVRCLVQKLMKTDNEEDKKTRNILVKQLASKIAASHAQHTLSEAESFMSYVEKDARLRQLFTTLTELQSNRKQIDAVLQEIVSRLSNRGCPSGVQNTGKMLLERASPLLVDRDAILTIVTSVHDIVVNENPPQFLLHVPENTLVDRCVRLLLVLCCSFTPMFIDRDIVRLLNEFLLSNYPLARETAARIFAYFGEIKSDNNFDPDDTILPELEKLLKNLAYSGTSRQAKCAIRAIGAIFNDHERIFENIFKECCKHMSILDKQCVAGLESMGAMIRLHANDSGNETDKSNANESINQSNASTQLAVNMKRLIATTIVKDIVLNNQDHEFNSDYAWVEHTKLSQNCKAKIAGIRFIARFLIGIRSNDDDVGTKTIKLLVSIIESRGDIRKSEKIKDAEMAHLRVEAGCALLKLARYSIFHSIISPDQFSVIATLIHDDCQQVRAKFVQKLHTGLTSPRLPLRYMSMYALVPLTQPSASKTVEDYKKSTRNALDYAIVCRRRWMKTMVYCQERPSMFLPEYSILQAVYLLAHTARFGKWTDLNAIQVIRDCFWYLIEALVSKHNNMCGNVQLLYKLLQDIKQMEDKHRPNNKTVQQKLWVVCDLGILLLTYRVPNYDLQQLPKSTAIDKVLYLPMKQFATKNNTSVYIPTEIIEFEKRNQVKKGSKSKKVNGANKTGLNSTTLSKTAAASSTASDGSISDTSTMPPQSPPPAKKKPVKRKAAPPKTATKTKRRTKDSSEELSDIVESDDDGEEDAPLEFLKSPTNQPKTSTPAVGNATLKRRAPGETPIRKSLPNASLRKSAIANRAKVVQNGSVSKSAGKAKLVVTNGHAKSAQKEKKNTAASAKKKGKVVVTPARETSKSATPLSSPAKSQTPVASPKKAKETAKKSAPTPPPSPARATRRPRGLRQKPATRAN